MSSGTCYQSTLHLPGSNHRLIKTVALISNPNHIKSVNRPTANQSAPAQCAAAMDEQKKGKKAGTETKGDDTGWKNVRVYGWTKVAHDDRTLPGNTPRAKKNVPTFGPSKKMRSQQQGWSGHELRSSTCSTGPMALIRRNFEMLSNIEYTYKNKTQ